MLNIFWKFHLFQRKYFLDEKWKWKNQQKNYYTKSNILKSQNLKNDLTLISLQNMVKNIFSQRKYFKIWTNSNQCIIFWWDLSCVATVVFNVRLLHAFAFSKKLPWLAQNSVITLKMQTHAVNARWKRLSQRSFNIKVNSKLLHPRFSEILDNTRIFEQLSKCKLKEIRANSIATLIDLKQKLSDFLQK